MNDISYLGKCGCDCKNCPTYKENLTSVKKRIVCSRGWEKYLKIKLSPEKLRACDGCSLPDSKRKIYYLNCTIRKCALTNEIGNCAYCDEFPCDELKNVHSLQNIRSKNEYVDKYKKDISGIEYDRFVEPYAGIKHLNFIRGQIKSNEIKSPKPFSIKNRNKPFPERIRHTKYYPTLLKLYNIITTIEDQKNIPYARLSKIEKRREQIHQLLWTIGLYGKITIRDDAMLELDCKKYLEQKNIGFHSKLLELIHLLTAYGILIEIIITDEKSWLTPMGGLRKTGWKIEFKFDKKAGGKDTILALQEYVKRLVNKYNKKAFRYFKIADMQVMESQT